jgi:hypothetical protein
MQKKWILRVIVLLGVFVSSLLIVAPAMAIWVWCDVDPTLNIDGHVVSLQTSIQGDPQEINGKIKFSVSVPDGIKSSVVSCDHDAKVKISGGKGTQVQVFVDIKTKTTYIDQLMVFVDGTQVVFDKGTTDGELVCSFIAP